MNVQALSVWRKTWRLYLVAHGSSADTIVALFYHVEANCNGLPCESYNKHKELNRVVCTVIKVKVLCYYIAHSVSCILTLQVVYRGIDL